MTLGAVHAEQESLLTGYMLCTCPQTVLHLFTGIQHTLGIQHMLGSNLSWSSSYMAFLESCNQPINPSIKLPFSLAGESIWDKRQ